MSPLLQPKHLCRRGNFHPRRWLLSPAWLAVVWALVAFLVPGPVRAQGTALKIPWLGIDLGALIFLGLSYVLQAVAYLLGRGMVLAVFFLSKIISYNEFIHFEAVTLGWEILRDISNLVFIVILLLIAIATILKVESYNLKRLLPKLLLMAILVNFSKTIAGVLIDAAQVVTLTFASAVAGVTEGNLYSKFGIADLFTISKVAFQADIAGNDMLRIFTSLLLAVFMLFVALMVVLSYLLIFLFRIVVLWILVILSPLAYALAAFPQGERISREWWSTFSKYVIAGPIIMFFFWLAIATTEQAFQTTLNPDTPAQPGFPLTQKQELSLAVTKAGQPDNVLKFLVMTCLMLGGLVAAQRVGVAGSAFAGNVLSGMRSYGMGAVRRAIRLQTAPLRTARWLGQHAVLQPIGRFLNRKILENKATRWMTPSWWAGARQSSERLLQQERVAAAGKGEEWAERWMEERLKGRPGAARRRGEEAERRVVNEFKSEMTKELSATDFSKEKWGELARRAFASTGKRGERMQQAIMELSSSHGNLDDVYEYLTPHIHQQLGFEGEEWRTESPTMFRKFLKGFLWHGNLKQANQYDPEEILKDMVAGDPKLKKVYEKFVTEGPQALSEDEESQLLEARQKARERAQANADHASMEDKLRLLSVATIAEGVKDVGHWEQVLGQISPESGVARFRDVQEQIDEVIGEMQKRGTRPMLAGMAPHNVRSKKYDKDEKAYRPTVKFEDMDAYQKAFWGPRGALQSQVADQMGHMQPRIIRQFIGPYFDDETGEVITDDKEAERRGFDNAQHLQESFVHFRALNPVMTDYMWQFKYTGAKHADRGTSYANPWKPARPEEGPPLQYASSKPGRKEGERELMPSGGILLRAQERLRSQGELPPEGEAPSGAAPGPTPGPTPGGAPAGGPRRPRPRPLRGAVAPDVTRSQEQLVVLQRGGLSEAEAQHKYDKRHEAEIRAGTMLSSAQLERIKRMAAARAVGTQDEFVHVAAVEERPQELTQEEREKNPQLKTIRLGLNFAAAGAAEQYGVEPDMLAATFTAEDRGEVVKRLAEDYGRELQQRAQAVNQKIAQLSPEQQHQAYEDLYQTLGRRDADRRYADQVVGQWAKHELEAGNERGRVEEFVNKRGEKAYRYKNDDILRYQQGEALRQMYQEKDIASLAPGEQSIQQRQALFAQKLGTAEKLILHNTTALGNRFTADRHESGHLWSDAMTEQQKQDFRSTLVEGGRQRELFDKMGVDEYLADAIGRNTGELELTQGSRDYLDKLKVRYRGKVQPQAPPDKPELAEQPMTEAEEQELQQQFYRQPVGKLVKLVDEHATRQRQWSAQLELTRQQLQQAQNDVQVEVADKRQQLKELAAKVAEHRRAANESQGRHEDAAAQQATAQADTLQLDADRLAKEIAAQDKTIAKRLRQPEAAVTAAEQGLQQNNARFQKRQRKLVGRLSEEELAATNKQLTTASDQYTQQAATLTNQGKHEWAERFRNAAAASAEILTQVGDEQKKRQATSPAGIVDRLTSDYLQRQPGRQLEVEASEARIKAAEDVVNSGQQEHQKLLTSRNEMHETAENHFKAMRKAPDEAMAKQEERLALEAELRWQRMDGELAAQERVIARQQQSVGRAKRDHQSLLGRHQGEEQKIADQLHEQMAQLTPVQLTALGTTVKGDAAAAQQAAAEAETQRDTTTARASRARELVAKLKLEQIAVAQREQRPRSAREQTIERRTTEFIGQREENRKRKEAASKVVGERRKKLEAGEQQLAEVQTKRAEAQQQMTAHKDEAAKLYQQGKFDEAKAEAKLSRQRGLEFQTQQDNVTQQKFAVGRLQDELQAAEKNYEGALEQAATAATDFAATLDRAMQGRSAAELATYSTHAQQDVELYNQEVERYERLGDRDAAARARLQAELAGDWRDTVNRALERQRRDEGLAAAVTQAGQVLKVAQAERQDMAVKVPYNVREGQKRLAGLEPQLADVGKRVQQYEEKVNAAKASGSQQQFDRAQDSLATERATLERLKDAARTARADIAGWQDAEVKAAAAVKAADEKLTAARRAQAQGMPVVPAAQYAAGAAAEAPRQTPPSGAVAEPSLPDSDLRELSKEFSDYAQQAGTLPKQSPREFTGSLKGMDESLGKLGMTLDAMEARLDEARAKGTKTDEELGKQVQSMWKELEHGRNALDTAWTFGRNPAGFTDEYSHQLIDVLSQIEKHLREMSERQPGTRPAPPGGPPSPPPPGGAAPPSPSV